MVCFRTLRNLTPSGRLTTLHSSDRDTDNAAFPKFLLTLGPDGNFYDASEGYYGGGFDASDSLFGIAPKGGYTDLFSGFGNPNACDYNANGCIPSSVVRVNRP